MYQVHVSYYGTGFGFFDVYEIKTEIHAIPENKIRRYCLGQLSIYLKQLGGWHRMLSHYISLDDYIKDIMRQYDLCTLDQLISVTIEKGTEYVNGHHGRGITNISKNVLG